MSLVLVLMLLAQDVPLAAVSVPDEELATQRGGFTLPNGIDVALTVQTQTVINGAVVLRTVFRADQGAPTLTVYAPKTGETVAADRVTTVGGTAGLPTVTYDGRGGLQVTPAVGGPGVSVASGSANAAVPAGLAVLAAGGSITDNGTVSQTTTGGLQTAELRTADLSITHLAGTAFGSAIANSGSDRTIDTQTSVGLDLRNVDSTVLASAMLRVEDVASAAMLNRQ
ncbi:MAG: hypothetical protein EOP67_18725 [Sphingomonas sp.]|nr:MAG: hypothetical protein EOP67_18725 [Sphingomonas sp.]